MPVCAYSSSFGKTTRSSACSIPYLYQCIIHAHTLDIRCTTDNHVHNRSHAYIIVHPDRTSRFSQEQELQWQRQGASREANTYGTGIMGPISHTYLFASRPIPSSESPDQQEGYEEERGYSILSVLPSATCATTSTAQSSASLQTDAATPVSFMLRSFDAHGNRVYTGGDIWYVEALPFSDWDVLEPLGTYTSSSSAAGRISKDCISCVSARGSVQDLGDGSYEATLALSRTGSYKVLSDLLSATGSGVAATYYHMHSQNATVVGPPAFLRIDQHLDSLLDFASVCTLDTPSGIRPGQVPTPSALSSTQQGCSGWMSGMAVGGSANGILLDVRPWAESSLSAFRANVSDWTVRISQGTCQGQWRALTAFSESLVAAWVLNVSVAEGWSGAGGLSATGAFGEAFQQVCTKCPHKQPLNSC